YLRRRPIDSIRSLVQVKQRLAHLVGLQEPPNSLQQVEETVAAHHQLQEAFARSRHLIPKGQLVEIAYDDLVQSPLETLQRIYSALEIGSWDSASDAIAVRSAKGKAYKAKPVVLEPVAEQRLQTLLS
ncbi:sulfotransferase, partial [Synechococcus sp. MU1655]|uniref:sulfotransferase n=1 Tax=Synechococcus sp. MU1655 TaxID=2508355 RepID=UPI002026D202